MSASQSKQCPSPRCQSPNPFLDLEEAPTRPTTPYSLAEAPNPVPPLCNHPSHGVSHWDKHPPTVDHHFFKMMLRFVERYEVSEDGFRHLLTGVRRALDDVGSHDLPPQSPCPPGRKEIDALFRTPGPVTFTESRTPAPQTVIQGGEGPFADGEEGPGGPSEEAGESPPRCVASASDSEVKAGSPSLPGPLGAPALSQSEEDLWRCVSPGPWPDFGPWPDDPSDDPAALSPPPGPAMDESAGRVPAPGAGEPAVLDVHRPGLRRTRRRRQSSRVPGNSVRGPAGGRRPRAGGSGGTPPAPFVPRSEIRLSLDKMKLRMEGLRQDLVFLLAGDDMANLEKAIEEHAAQAYRDGFAAGRGQSRSN
ncbi:hypothetical protein SERLADRAFT_441267 [Serpula lacrymans var. lacrymans S7.9]|uniref:Uncharacterized protein n=1 Tax=Serpula lacrymans var. lacrymans (strain S7.9) TaxID=578457 RepID=F8P611_SERL9|nr:uncharacterized protein SERLADRAFT_441267 [Serpula lacrymans var. lacrymans S7.9]EGO20878.1 hypothetical protein SERLADRAFT_441267 [Serpula lacrymans var. lacrymans S7.9]